jgi:hypothetical protein
LSIASSLTQRVSPTLVDVHNRTAATKKTEGTGSCELVRLGTEYPFTAS